MIYLGLGLNYWFNDALALTLKTTYKVYSKEFDNLIGDGGDGNHHFQHVAGLSFAFGDGDTWLCTSARND